MLRRLMIAAGLAAALLPRGAAAPPAPEERVFRVTVDGKPAGEYRMKFEAAADGTETVTTTARIRTRILVKSYRYDGTTKETYAAGRLLGLSAATDDDGTKSTVSLAAAADGTRTLTVNGKARAAAEMVPLTGTRPPAGDKSRDVTVLDPSDGVVTACKLEELEPVKAAGVPAAARTFRRYKLAGKNVDAEWWFDESGRPAHQKMTADGHKVVLELADPTR